MTTVPFTTVCDFCAKRAEEYSSWPVCRECGLDCCLACAEPGTTDADETGYRTTCRECADADEEEARKPPMRPGFTWNFEGDDCPNCGLASGFHTDDGECVELRADREKGDDDGVEYADPRDELEERRRD